MDPGTVILDSEDDGSDFSPIKPSVSFTLHTADGIAPGTEVEFEQPHDGSSNEISTKFSSLKSTDPDFFEHIYNEQIAAAAGQNGNATDYAPATEANKTAQSEGSSSQPREASSLTSITGPGKTNRRGKQHNNASSEEVIDLSLTQITTPRKASVVAEVDPWDVPSSPVPHLRGGLSGNPSRSASKELKTYGKRKRLGQVPTSSPAGQGMDDLPSTASQSPTRSTKRTRRGIQSPLPPVSEDSSPVVLVPQREDDVGGDVGEKRSSRKRRPSSRGLEYGFSVPDTALHIAPSALTASQKQQYQRAALLSNPDEVVLVPVLPVLAGEQQKSSMATTIPFSTPRQPASSGLGAEAPEYLPSTADPGAPPNIPRPDTSLMTTAQDDPLSSPDVISEEPRKAKRGCPQEASSEGRSVKKRKGPIPQSQVNDDNVEGHVDSVNKQSQKRRGKKLPVDDGVASLQALDPDFAEYYHPGFDAQANIAAPDLDPDFSFSPAKEQQPELPTLPTQKKRGRKKKSVVSEGTVDELPREPGLGPLGEAVNTGEPDRLVKTKRGRPRKSVLPEVEGPSAREATPAAATEPPPPPPPAAKPGRRGRKKKEVTKSAEFVLDEEKEMAGVAEPEAAPAFLSEVSQNSRQSSARNTVINDSDDDDDNYDGDTNENETTKKAAETPPKAEIVEKKKEVKKATPATTVSNRGSTPKVPLRVGLSKKSRIAPLLKSLRK